MTNAIIAAQRIGVIQAQINERTRPTPQRLAEVDLEMWAKKIGWAISQGKNSCRYAEPLKTLWDEDATIQHRMRLGQTYINQLESLLGKPFRVQRVGTLISGYVSVSWI